MEPLRERLKSGRLILADGAMGTMLMARGLAAGKCPESVIVENPAQVEAVTRLYIGAGAELVLTNTFGASPLKLGLQGLEKRTAEINRKAVEIARGVARSHAYVAASVGPSGRLLKPHGDLDPDKIARSYHRQIQILVKAGIDAVCVETMTDLNEAVIAVTACRIVSPDIPVIATMTFDPTPRGLFTVMGVGVEQAARELTKAGCDAVGANCGQGSDTMVGVAKAFKQATDRPIAIRPNAGLPVLEGKRTVYPETPDYFADNCAELARLGVAVIGGCCGTTPAHIRAVAKALQP